MAPPLACPVRGCGLPLERRPRAWICKARHSHDIARSGYVNLLQPQDRRSSAAGDSAFLVSARARLLQAGVGQSLIDAVSSRVGALLSPQASVLELGSGSGDALAAIAGAHSLGAIGIDLSARAANVAARRFPAVTWVVANADRTLPILEQTIALVCSLYGRRNPLESARVLTSRGGLLIAVPAPDDLAELREVIQGAAVVRDRSEAVIADHRISFELVDRFAVRATLRLERGVLLDLLKTTYRGERHSAAARVELLDSLNVTTASDVMLFERR